jgi:uncharacterized glyoxalase superfamily protein PhnB
VKIAPTLIVEKINPSVKFWVEQLGFSKVTELPGEDGPVFVLLQKGDFEVHFQTRASAATDMPYFAGSQMPSSSFLYIDVDDVHALHAKLKDVEILLPLEKTFYGATHFFIREPGGHVVGFSQNGSLLNKVTI